MRPVRAAATRRRFVRIEGVPFATIDWSRVPETEHPGESGTAELQNGTSVVMTAGMSY